MNGCAYGSPPHPYHLPDPVHASLEWLIADHGVDLTTPRRHAGSVEHLHHSFHVFTVGSVIIGEAPWATVDRPPARQHVAIKGARLEPAVRVQ